MTDALPTRTPITVEEVRAAIETLHAQGARVTLRGIRHALGNRGSYDTIGAFRREVEGAAPAAAAAHEVTPPQVTARLSELAPDIWRAACAAARDAVAAELSTLRQQFSRTQQHERELEGLLAEADERLDRDGAARAADQARIEQLSLAISALAERLDAAVAQHTAAATRAADALADREQTIAQLVAQCATAQAQVDDLRAAAHLDAQRAVDEADARVRLEQALSEAVNHQAQQEQRHGAALDLLRHERDGAVSEAAGRLRERDLARAEAATSAGQLTAAIRGQDAAQVRVHELTKRVEHLAGELASAVQTGRDATAERDRMAAANASEREQRQLAAAGLAEELAAQRGILSQVLQRLSPAHPVANPGGDGHV